LTHERGHAVRDDITTVTGATTAEKCDRMTTSSGDDEDYRS